MSQNNNPVWWTKEQDSAWDRAKAAFKRDWDQTKHDVGGNEPDTNQGVTDTVKQAAGKEPIPARGRPVFEAVEPAYRFGYGARLHYGKTHAEWDPELEKELHRDWRMSNADRPDPWDADAKYIRSGWNHQN